MKLTPLDIHHKEFRRALRGYNEEEVDVFLDQVAEEFERVFKENIDSKEQVEKMREKVKQYEGVEETLQKALLTAQKAADEVQSNAQKESDLIIKDAELKAKEIIQHILTDKQNLNSELSTLRAAEKEFKEKFKDMLTQYLNVVEKGQKIEVPEVVPQPEPEEKEASEPSPDIEAIDEIKAQQETVIEKSVEEVSSGWIGPEAKRAEIEAKEAEIEAKRVEAVKKREENEAKHEQLDAQENVSDQKTNIFGKPQGFGAPPNPTVSSFPTDQKNGLSDEVQKDEAKPNSDGEIKVTLSSHSANDEQKKDDEVDGETKATLSSHSANDEQKKDDEGDAGLAAASVSSFFDDDLGVDEEEKKPDWQVNTVDGSEGSDHAEGEDEKP